MLSPTCQHQECQAAAKQKPPSAFSLFRWVGAVSSGRLGQLARRSSRGRRRRTQTIIISPT
eukprot:6252970-Pyramimonas_sp.AAC.1